MVGVVDGWWDKGGGRLVGERVLVSDGGGGKKQASGK